VPDRAAEGDEGLGVLTPDRKVMPRRAATPPGDREGRRIGPVLEQASGESQEAFRDLDLTHLAGGPACVEKAGKHAALGRPCGAAGARHRRRQLRATEGC